MAPETRLRQGMTRILAIGHLVFFLAWLFPFHGPVLPGRLNIPAVVASNAPVWTVGFGVTAALLIVAVIRRSMAAWGHAVGAVATMSYGAASLFSALFSTPYGSVLPGGAFLLIAAWHYALQRYYRGAGA